MGNNSEIFLSDFTNDFVGEVSPVFETALSQWDIVALAIVILIFGWLFGKFLETIIVKIGERPFVRNISEKSGFSTLLQKADIDSPPEQLVGNFVMGYIFTIFVLIASKMLGINAISQFLQSVISYIPNMIVALVIILFGIRFSHTTSSIIESGFKLVQSSSGKILAIVSKGVIITFTILAALAQLEIATNIVLILFIGFVSMLTIAGGLAFGLGGKEIIAEFLEDLQKNARDQHSKNNK